MIGRNNPLNIRTSAHYNWDGQEGATRGFCNFAGVEKCRRAGAYLLMRSYRRAGVKTVAQVINRWAPTCENNTNAYISFVCKRTGFKPDTELVFITDFAAVLAAMEIFEQGVINSTRDGYFRTAKASYEYLIEYYHIKRV